jgi:GDPmannose 4,6-dehydratase
MYNQHQPVALICGISGQDGSYLAKFLLDRGYKVFGTSRDAAVSSFERLKRLGIRDRVEVVSMALNDFRSVLQVLAKLQPQEVYNLAGQSSVGLSFEQPVETLESISIGTLNLLEAIRFLDKKNRFYNAGSSECFGDTGTVAATELTPFRPRSPYAVAKSAAFWQVASYRDTYQLHVCSGILFNHESPLRPDRFVTQKIVRTACRIAAGSSEKLRLGNLSIERDWGWAPDYVEAMWLMLQRDKPEDFIVATGQSYTLEAFVAHVFSILQMDWRDHTVVDGSLLRPADQLHSRADPSKARELLGWTASCSMHAVAERMVQAAMSLHKAD